jgi:hypothetical protein
MCCAPSSARSGKPVTGNCRVIRSDCGEASRCGKNSNTHCRINRLFAAGRSRLRTCKRTFMLLVITPSRGCAQAIQHVTSEETHVAATLSQALVQLRAQQYVAVLIDQAFLETEPVESDMVLEHIGTAVPVQINFAISGMDRVVHDLRAALHRRNKEVLVVRQEAQQALRNELKSTITALLPNCELALKVP